MKASVDLIFFSKWLNERNFNRKFIDVDGKNKVL